MTKDVLQTPETPVTEDINSRRFLFNGEYVNETARSSTRGNRRVSRRRRSPFTFLFVVMAISLVVVLYIWNKITVIRLAEEINDLQIQHQKILSANEFLRVGINQKSKLERIGKIATEQLGLTYPKEQPIWFEVDPERLREIQIEQVE